jgi:hypothetical protein
MPRRTNVQKLNKEDFDENILNYREYSSNCVKLKN